MKKSKFFKSAFTLLVGSLITRILGFFIKIVFIRAIGQDGINLYSLIMPTYSLIITLTQLGLPIAISTLVARGNKRCKKILISVLPITIILNIVMIFGVLSSASFIGNVLLDAPDSVYPIKCMALVLPFISITSILKGYFFGKQNMFPHTLSNVIEQIVRLIIILTILPVLIEKGSVYAVSGFILLGVISEFVSIIVFLSFLPKKFAIKKEDIKPDLGTTKEILGLTMPTVSGRILGNIAYFLEPIILTFTMQYVGYTNEFIETEYAIYNSYVIPLLVIPSFIVQSLSTALVPEISKLSQERNAQNIKKRLFESIALCLGLGIVVNTFVFLYPEVLLKLIYGTFEGAEYVKVLAIPFILYNLEGPLCSILEGLGKTKLLFRTTLFGTILKTLCITIFSLLKIGIYGLIIGEILNILLVVIMNLVNVYNLIKKNSSFY